MKLEAESDNFTWVGHDVGDVGQGQTENTCIAPKECQYCLSKAHV